MTSTATDATALIKEKLRLRNPSNSTASTPPYATTKARKSLWYRGAFLFKCKNRCTNKIVVTPEKMPIRCTSRIPNHVVLSNPNKMPWYPSRKSCENATPIKNSVYSR